MMLGMYQITLPIRDNEGHDVMGQHVKFRQFVLNLIGGYTQLPQCQGIWDDPETRKYHTDDNLAYQIACVSDRVWDQIVAKAFDLFPDQISILHVRMGTATIDYAPPGRLKQ